MKQNFGQAVGVTLFWTNSEETFSRMIRRVTGGDFSHMGIIFRMECGKEIYFESLFSKGVTGPHAFEDLRAWAQKPGHKLIYEPVPWLTAEQCQAMYRRAYERYGQAGYGKFQVLSHWWMERVGKRYGFRMRNTPDKVTCSEYVARVCAPDLVLMDEVRDHFDAVTPESARAQFQRIKRTLAASGAFDFALAKYASMEPTGK